MSRHRVLSLTIGITSFVICTTEMAVSAQSEDVQVVTQLAPNRATGPGDELERRGKRQQIAGGVLLGVGVAAPLVTLGVTRARTRGCDFEDCDTVAYMSTKVMMGVGILLGAVGTAVLIRGSFNRRKGRQKRLELGVGPGSLVVQGSF